MMATKRIPARELRVGMLLVVDHTQRMTEITNIDPGRSGTWIDVACDNTTEFIFHVDEMVTVQAEDYDF